MSIESTIILLKEFVTHGIQILPLIICAFSVIIGCGVGNVAYLFLALGIVVLVPITNAILNPSLNWILDFFLSSRPELYKIHPSVDCSVLGMSVGNPPAVWQPSIPSYWWSSVVFFGSYMFLNALQLATREAPANAQANKVQARKAQAGMAMAIILVLTASLLIYRFTQNRECETWIGISLGTVLYSALAYGWFNALKSCSGDALTDMFGIAGRMMPERNTEGAGSICYPVV